MYMPLIREKITSYGYGSIFMPSDFKDIANRETVKKSLQRFNEEKFIKRIMRGVYHYPEYNEFLGEYVEPSPHEVAKAIARNYGWTIVPFGDTALNLLGLSSQVPAVWTYVSDGAYKEYDLDKISIKFKRTTNKEISGLSYKTALIIQAIKALGKANIDEQVIKSISRKISYSEMEEMISEGKYSTSWVYEVLKKIAKEKS